MAFTVSIPSKPELLEVEGDKQPRVAWLLQGAGAYWQPILSEFTHLLQDTKVFAAEWSGFMPGFEDTFAVQRVGPMKVFKLPGKAGGYNNSFTYLPPDVIKPLIEYRPHVVFTVGFSLWSVLVCLLKIVFRWRVVIIYDGSSPGVDYSHSPLRSLQRRWLSHLTDAFITNNQAGKQYLVESLRVPAEQVFARPYLLPHPKTYAPTLEISNPLLAQQTRPIFIFAGHLIPRKGLRELLESCAILVQKGYEHFTLMVVGEGSERAELETYVKQQGLTAQVNWIGFVEYEQVGAYFSAADVFVFPTREDVWGLVVVEAMLFGKPVLVSQWAGASEMLLEGDNGYIFNPHEPQQLAELMEKFINDPKLIDCMGDRSKRIMDNHRLEQVAQYLTEIVDFVLS